MGGSPAAATLLGTALAEARVAITNGTVSSTGLVLFNKSSAGDALNDPALLKRIADAISRQGNSLEIAEAGTDLYNYYKALGAQGSTMMLEDGKISIGLSADAGPSALFEELVHYGQYKSGQVDRWTAQYGLSGAVSISEYEAAYKLVKNASAYGISAAENAENMKRLAQFAEEAAKVGYKVH